MNNRQIEEMVITVELMMQLNPDNSRSEIIDTLKTIHRCQTHVHRYAEIMCERDLSKNEEHQLERQQDKIKFFMKKLHPDMNVKFQWDPRGAVVKLLLPIQRSNSWDGENVWILNW
jgi:hypothetical protein